MKKELIKLASPEAVAAYAWLAKPDEGQEFSDGKYKMTIILDPETTVDWINDLKEKSNQVAKKEWGKVPANMRYCFRDGNDSKNEDFHNKLTITAKSKFQPGFVGTDKKPLPEDVQPASGDIVRASIALIPYKAGGNQGVTAQLHNVMLIEKRNNGSSATEDFAEIEAVEKDNLGETNDDDFDI